MLPHREPVGTGAAVAVPMRNIDVHLVPKRAITPASLILAIEQVAREQREREVREEAEHPECDGTVATRVDDDVTERIPSSR